MKVLNRNVQRIDRLYFWIAWITVLIAEHILTAVWFATWQSCGTNIAFYGLSALSVFLLIYRLLLCVKRFHDAGYSTWYYILCVLLSAVLVGIVMWFLVVIKDSDKDNMWGINPARENFEKSREYYAD